MSKALATKNVAAVLLAVAMVFGFAFAFAAPAKAASVSDLQSQVNALLAQIAALQGSSSSTSMSSSSCHTFTQNLKQGSKGGEVMWVQQFLNSMPDTMVAASGAGSKGNETSSFGPATKKAVIMFQNKYAADILTPNGLSKGTGVWGPATRAKANALCAGSTSTTGTTGGTTTGTGTGTGTTTTTVTGTVTVGAATQPANSLAPAGAARVPFTTFTLTNTSSAPITINSVTVQRTGLGADAAFSGLVLVDETGTQLGNSRTLNSSHQANVGDPFTINPGQTKTITVAGNMASDLTSYAGQVISLTVVGINTSATVSGSLPISGAQQTMNATLSIGTLAATLGSADLNAQQTNQSIGTTNLTGASLRLTAGSAEDVWMKSIRWNQSGSAGSGDVANVRVVIGGTSYPTVVSPDGKYYTAVFPGNGIQIAKGLNIEAMLKFDIVSGPNRTAIFDVYKNTDIYAVGGTYGYGINVTQSQNGTVPSPRTGSTFTSGTPFFGGSEFDISAGTVTSLSRANEVPAQNITINAPSQVLGGFAMDVKGEPILVQKEIYHINYSSNTASSNLITSVRLVDEKGAVVAGPVDAKNNSGTEMTVTFTDTVTFATGRHVYTLQGMLPSTVSNGQTISASTTPSTDWSNSTGQQTGNSISLSSLSTAVSGNTMTVRTGAVAVSVAATPAAQTVVAGVSGQVVSAFNLDATQSGEDVNFTSVKIYYTKTNLLPSGSNPTNCFLYDGTTRLNSTAIQPTTTATDYTFTLDNGAVKVSKGTVKLITMKCDVPAAISSGSFSFGVNASSGNATFTGTGVSSTQSITPTSSTGAVQNGNTMTIATAGALTVALDISSPSYVVASVGANGVTSQPLSILRFSGTNEDMRLDRVGLTMSNSSASSSPNNINQVTLWAPVDSTGRYSASGTMTQVGTAVFAGTRFATSTLSQTLIIPANQYAVVTVKGDLAGVSLNGAGTEGALLQVDYNGSDSTGTRAIGQSSGSTINQSSSSNTSSSGVRTFKTKPVVVAPVSGTPTNLGVGDQELYRFTVTADASGDVGIYRVTANIATSSASTASGTTTVSNLRLFAYDQSGNGASGFIGGLISQVNSGNGVASGVNQLTVNQNSLDKIEVPAGQTYTFKVIGNVAQVAGSTNSAGYVQTKLVSDTAYPLFGTLMGTAGASGTVTADTNNNFIWSPNATSTTPTSGNDWINGYNVQGLQQNIPGLVTVSKSS